MFKRFKDFSTEISALCELHSVLVMLLQVGAAMLTAGKATVPAAAAAYLEELAKKDAPPTPATDPPKADAAKTDPPKPDATKTDPPKADPLKAAAAKTAAKAAPAAPAPETAPAAPAAAPAPASPPAAAAPAAAPAPAAPAPAAPAPAAAAPVKK